LKGITNIECLFKINNKSLEDIQLPIGHIIKINKKINEYKCLYKMFLEDEKIKENKEIGIGDGDINNYQNIEEKDRQLLYEIANRDLINSKKKFN